MVRKQSLDLFARVLDAAEHVADALSSFFEFLQWNGGVELKTCSSRFTSSHGLGELVEGISVLVIDEGEIFSGDRRRAVHEVVFSLQVEVHGVKLRRRWSSWLIAKDAVSKEIGSNLLINVHDVKI